MASKTTFLCESGIKICVIHFFCVSLQPKVAKKKINNKYLTKLIEFMRKIFTFLCAALMSVGMYAATTVTWNSSTLSSIQIYDGGQSFTKDGVTLTALAGMIDGEFGEWMGMSNDASFKFSTSLGNFSKIEITGNINALGGSGWTQTSPGAVWTGEANETTCGTYFVNVSQIVFTIADPTVAVTGVTLNQNEAQMTVGGETLTLTATVNPDNATDQSVSWSTSDANVATVDNGVVTAVAAGTATITVTTTDGSFTATCAVTVSNPAPAGEVTVVFAANNNTVEKTVTLPHTFWCDLGTEDGELDRIIQELYALPLGGYCDAWGGPVAAGNPAVTAGADGNDNDFIIISEAFEGTATVSGKYNKYTEMDETEFYYTLTVSTKGSATAISNTAVEAKAIKRIVNGQLFIEKNGKIYNATGAEVK